MTDSSFMIGDKVEKATGYSFPGVVVAVFATTRGATRLVVEMEGFGLLHIFSPENLKIRP